MKRLLFVVALATATAPAFAADVGVSLSIGQPDFYGRIDIGDYPQPQVIYRRPIVLERVPADRTPIYLRVPPGHAKHWSKHCHEYNACGERVFFVQDNWYKHEYVPRYQERVYEYRNNPVVYERRDEIMGGRRDGRMYERRDENMDDQRGHHGNDRRSGNYERGR